jgi:hypothetical protein
VASRSAWNRALREGKISRVAMGPTAHNGTGGYFGPDPLPDGHPRIDLTLETVIPIITGGDVGVLPPALPPLPPAESTAAAPAPPAGSGVSKS